MILKLQDKTKKTPKAKSGVLMSENCKTSLMVVSGIVTLSTNATGGRWLRL
jgi:hypothetical protein